MTKPRKPNPQPTSGTNYDLYVWPRSKTPQRNVLYERLHAIGWRYDNVFCEWYTPERWPVEGHGRLETAPDLSWARIQPPSVIVDGQPVRPSPLMVLKAEVIGGEIVYTEATYAVPEA